MIFCLPYWVINRVIEGSFLSTPRFYVKETHQISSLLSSLSYKDFLLEMGLREDVLEGYIRPSIQPEYYLFVFMYDLLTKLGCR